MLRIMSFEPQNTGVLIMVESDEFMADTPGVHIRYILATGILETYLDRYGFPAGACFTALMLDAFYEDVEMPHWETDYEAEFQRIVALGPDRIEWQCDKNELLAAVTIDEDDAEAVSGTWVAVKQMNEERAASFQKTEEERQAADFVDSLPFAMTSQPRDLEPDLPESSVALGIQFVD